MSFKMNVVYVLVLCGWLSMVVEAADECKTCMSNEILCLDSSTYQYCMQTVPQTHTNITCPRNTFCSASGDICSSVSAASVCKVQSQQCSVLCTKTLRCFSKTEYVRCSITDDKPKTCPNDYLCVLDDTDGAKCAPQCAIDFLKLKIPCPEPAQGVKPPADAMKTQCQDANRPATRPFVIPNTADEKCTSYIFCEYIKNVMTGTFFKCDDGKYFDLERERCVRSKPSSCTP